jgi:hypothetical protein
MVAAVRESTSQQNIRQAKIFPIASIADNQTET